MSFEPVFQGDVTADGERLVLFDAEQDNRRAHLRTLAGCRVDVVVTKHRDTRSRRANAYYWSCVLGEMAKYCEHTEEEIHDVMCERFLPNEAKRIEFFNRLTGECLTVEIDHRRTSKLHGGPFYDFVERVRQFAIEFMGVETQDPDPQYWRHRKSRAA